MNTRLLKKGLERMDTAAKNIIKAYQKTPGAVVITLRFGMMASGVNLFTYFNLSESFNQSRIIKELERSMIELKEKNQRISDTLQENNAKLDEILEKSEQLLEKYLEEQLAKKQQQERNTTSEDEEKKGVNESEEEITFDNDSEANEQNNSERHILDRLIEVCFKELLGLQTTEPETTEAETRPDPLSKQEIDELDARQKNLEVRNEKLQNDPLIRRCQSSPARGNSK